MKTKVETLKNVKQSYFEEALARMGFGIDWDNKEVHSAWRYNGDRTVDCVLTHLDSGRCAEIGIRFEEGEQPDYTQLTVLSDWDGKGYTADTFMKTLVMNYNVVKTMDVAASLGMTVESVEELERGSYKTRMVLRRAA